MRLKIEKKNLLALLARSQNVVEKRNTMPVLVNVLMEANEDLFRIFATNLEVSLTDQCRAEILDTGKVAVNARSLFDIVKELPDGSIELVKQENNWLKVIQNKSEFNIVGISADEYPVFPTYNTKDFIKVEPKLLLEMIEKTIYSVSTDETRYHLNGVYFEKSDQGKPSFRMVATDGHRLSLVDRSINKEEAVSGYTQGVIIPRKGLNEIRKLLDSTEDTFEMAIEGSQLIVRRDQTVLMIRLIEGKYPNYKQLIPQNLSENALINRDLLLSSLRRVSLLSNQKSKGVTLSLSNGLMQISSNNPELGDAKEELEIDYTGKELKIGFNAKYILDVLGSMEEEDIRLELKDQLSPGLLRPQSDSDYTCVIMPMRI